jgi:hypothetical protein
MLYVARYNHADSGLYEIRYTAGAGPPATDGDQTKLNGKTGPMAVNQARILIGDGDGATNYRLYYGDEGSIAGGITTLANFVDVAPYQGGSGLLLLAPTEPSDLLIARENAPWVAIQGDITATSTAIREYGGVHPGTYAEQDVTRTPHGIAYIVPGSGIYLTDGRTWTLLSKQIESFYKPALGGAVNLISWGTMAYLGQWLFCPKGYVYDFETGGWFKVTDLGSPSYWLADNRDFSVWGVREDENFIMYEYKPFDSIGGVAGSSRYHTYTWRSAPFARQDGRQTRIREVQIFLRASATSDITVTRKNADDGGSTARTVTGLTAGRHQVVFQFPNEGSEYQDITITPSAQVSSNEAPIIERVRVGFAPGRRPY